MACLHSLKQLCESKEFDPIAPSWCIVHYLLLQHDGASHIPLGAVVAASATCSLFSYDPNSVAPMYFNTIGATKRMEKVTGYTVDNVRTVEEEDAFQFIKKGIDVGKGIFVSGPEMGLCYGYEEKDDGTDRTLFGFADWGPGFNGKFSWDKFTRFTQAFGENEGFSILNQIGDPSANEEIVESIVEPVLDWPESHPALKYGQKKEFYGLKAFQRFINDVSDPLKRKQIDDAYINCFAIEFQAGGRYWLGHYLKALAQTFQDEVSGLVNSIGDLYIQSYEKLREFQQFDILQNKTEQQITDAIQWLRDAYQFEEKILEDFLVVRQKIK